MKLLVLGAVAAVLLGLVFFESARTGPERSAGDGAVSAETVGRDVAGPSARPGPSRGVDGVRMPAAAGRVQARPSGVLARPMGGDWSLSMVVRFTDGIAASEWSDVLHGAVTEDNGARREFGVRLRPDGRAIALQCDLDGVDFDRASFSLATSSYATQAADGRVLFGDTMERRGGKRLSAADAVDRATRRIDLGVVELLPPKHLGHLSFDPPVQRDMNAFVGIGSPPEAFAQVFRDRRLGQLVAVPVGTTSIRCSTFASPRTWFASLSSSSGQTVFRGDAEVGKDITVTVAADAGLDLTVDLVRSPDAGRVLLMRSNVPLEARLDDDAFFDRVRRTEWSAALPLPDRRVGKISYPVGLVEVKDGFYRIEVWSLKAPNGDRTLLSSRAVQVAGDLVTVTV